MSNNPISNVMVSMLAGNAVDPGSGQNKDYKIGICCLSVKHAALRRKRKYWYDRNQYTVSERSVLLFLRASTITIQLSVLA